MARKNQNPGLDLSGVGKSPLGLGKAHSKPFQPKSSVPPAGGLFSSKTSSPLRKRKVALIVLAVVAALALVIGTGYLAYRQSVQNALKPSMDSSAIASALVSDTNGDVQWGLLVVTNGPQDGTDAEGVSQMALVAADCSNPKISFVWVPTSLRVYVAGYGYQSLEDVHASLGDEGLLQTIADVAGTDINHFFKVSVPGMQKYASEAGLDSGASKENLAKAIVKKIVESSSEQISSQVSSLNNYLASDMSKESEVELFTSLKGIDSAKQIFNEDLPLEEEQTNEGFSQVKADEWATMQKRISSGLDPIATSSEINASNAVRQNYKVTIWNGVGVSGIASDCSKRLEEKGWSIESTGNAASFIYDETLIVYNYDDDKTAADLLVSDLGQGRAVRSAARYSFEGDILVVVGKDYQPY